MKSFKKLIQIDEAINSLNGVFPGEKDYDYLHFGPFDRYIASRWSRIAGLPYICTRAEFEARKAERDNSWQELCRRNESKHESYIQANVVEPWLKTPMTAQAKPNIDFEWLANQFDDADDINAVWALRDKLHHKNKPEPSPELSFHLSNAFNELQASARLLPEDDPRRASIVSLAGGVSAVKEVV